jgi:Asp-tRNA(Asn)/Glu-tRNA(Gln) amidotransferase A subunit family amidase
MDKSQLPFLSATELGSLIKSKEVSPVEAAEAYLERIPQIDGKLNSYITVTPDRALADAKKAEQEIVSGKYRGPMHGVPIAVQDQMYTKGILTTGGSTILKDFVPGEDTLGVHLVFDRDGHAVHRAAVLARNNLLLSFLGVGQRPVGCDRDVGVQLAVYLGNAL